MTRVNRVNYALFALLLGSIGAQYFYIHKPVAGILCIFFSWTTIPGIIGFIQGISALLATEDEDGCILV